jgi:cell division protein FtsL
MYNRLFEREAGEQQPSVETSNRVRDFANEDIYFFVKRIDNSGVVRLSDPKARGVCWKLIGSAGLAVILLIAVLLPSAYSLLAGYQIQSLRQEQARLLNDQASLELEEAQLLSPARIEQLARDQQFIDPPAQKVVYLNKGGALALNSDLKQK